MTRVIVKAKAMHVGETTTWADGTRHKKVTSNKWVLVSDKKSSSTKTDTKAEGYYIAATSMAWAGLGIVEHLEDKYNVTDFGGLKKLISNGPRGHASKVYRSIKDYVDSLTIATSNKGSAVDRIGRSLIALRDAYEPKAPKQKLTIKQRSKTGKVWYKKKAPQVASFSANKIKTAQKRLGGWSDMSKLPTRAQLDTMIKNKTAKVTWGKPQSKRKWVVYQKAQDITIPFKETEKGIKIKMRQFEEHEQRTRRTAVMELTIPYSYARQFIEKNIKSSRTRNELIGLLTRSAGYKKAAA